jgi:hypothetical protein
MPTVFAFDSDLAKNGKTEITRYRELDREANTRPAIKAFCVVRRGYWWLGGDGSDAHWHFVRPTPKHDEVICFVAGILNTIPKMLGQSNYSKLGHYIADDNTEVFDV